MKDLKKEIIDKIETLNLLKHPEGGYFNETYRSKDHLEQYLSLDFDGTRNLLTSNILVLVPRSDGIITYSCSKQAPRLARSPISFPRKGSRQNEQKEDILEVGRLLVAIFVPAFLQFDCQRGCRQVCVDGASPVLFQSHAGVQFSNGTLPRDGAEFSRKILLCSLLARLFSC